MGSVTFYTYSRGISSNGRALALHARGTGIDTRILQLYFVKNVLIVHEVLTCLQ